MIQGKHLVKTFEKHQKKGKKISFQAVDDISLSVGDNEIVGILGPNGAGKTTLLRMLATVMSPTSGSVSVIHEGKEIKNTDEIKRHIGYLSGNTKLYGRFSVRELLTMIGELYGMEAEDLKASIEEVTEVLSLGDFLDNRVEKLSTGQTQRASIARCLVYRPDIYIFDEPTLGLDILASSSIIEFMKGEKKRGKSVIYSTHYMEEAEYLCDRILLIREGHIIANDTPEALKQQTGAESIRDVFYSLVRQDVAE